MAFSLTIFCSMFTPFLGSCSCIHFIRAISRIDKLLFVLYCILSYLLRTPDSVLYFCASIPGCKSTCSCASVLTVLVKLASESTYFLLCSETVYRSCFPVSRLYVEEWLSAYCVHTLCVWLRRMGIFNYLTQEYYKVFHHIECKRIPSNVEENLHQKQQNTGDGLTKSALLIDKYK